MSTRDHPDWWRPVGGSNAQDSTLERRSLIWNDEDIEDGAAPDGEYHQPNYKGKFFPRGCRGMIESIRVYCRRAVGRTVNLNLSPHPALGPLIRLPLVAPLAWAWATLTVGRMWNYDSLFIWATDSQTNVWFGYCDGEPYDTHESADVGVTWAAVDNRIFIRVVYSGETPGDVPVSGTVNVIEIPSIGSTLASGSVPAVLSNDLETICEADGAGTMVEAKLDFYTSAAPTAGLAPPAVWYQLRILADGYLCSLTDNRDLTQSCVATSGRSSKGEFYQCTIEQDSWDRTCMRVRLPLKFRRHLTLQCVHTTGVAVRVDGTLYANLIR